MKKTKQTNQSPTFRQPPNAGGPRRIQGEPAKISQKSKSFLKKNLPYVIGGGSTGLGIALGYIFS